MNSEHSMTVACRKANGSRLADQLDRLVTQQDLGALATLRRGLGHQADDVPELYRYVLPHLSGLETVGQAERMREEDAALLVGPLYALWHQGRPRPGAAKGVSLGGAFRQLKDRSDSGGVEQRFVALLKASRDRLPDELRHAISLLKAKEIALDWAGLFGDLAAWDETDQRARHPVRRRWARDFWESARAPIAAADDDAGVMKSEETTGGGDDDD